MLRSRGAHVDNDRERFQADARIGGLFRKEQIQNTSVGTENG